MTEPTRDGLEHVLRKYLAALTDELRDEVPRRVAERARGLGRAGALRVFDEEMQTALDRHQRKVWDALRRPRRS